MRISLDGLGTGLGIYGSECRAFEFHPNARGEAHDSVPIMS